MAKAREIPGLRPDMTFSEAAARTVRMRAQELLDHAEGVLDVDDITRVHAMRVASRRLRAVLEIHAACFPGKLHRSVVRDVKALADALGARRDPDVQLGALERFAEKAGDAERPGIELFAATIRARQADGNDVLAAALLDMRERDLAGRLRALADAASPPEEPDLVGEPADEEVATGEALADEEVVELPAQAPDDEVAAAGASLVVVPVERGDAASVSGDELDVELVAPAGGGWPGGWGGRA